MTPPEMTPAPGVYKRSDSTVWQFCRKAPQDLSSDYPKGWARRCSLRTSDLAKANIEARRLHVECDQEFEVKRRQQNPQRVALSAALASTIAAEIRRWVLEADDNMRAYPEGPRALVARDKRRKVLAEHAELLSTPQGKLLADALPLHLFGSRLTIGGTEPGAIASPALEGTAEPVDPLAGLTEEEAAAVARWNEQGSRQAGDDLKRRNLRAFVPAVEAVARDMGLLLDLQGAEAVAGLEVCARAYRQAVADAARRDAGAVVETPDRPSPILKAPSPALASAPSGHSFQDAFDLWNRPGRVAKTVATFRAEAARLESILPGRTLESLTRADGHTIEVALLAAAEAKGGTAVNTAASRLQRFRTLLAAAVNEDWMQKNPLQGRKIDRVESNRREFDKASLKLLFADPLFMEYRIPPDRMAGADAAYFIPLLALYTGARISELAQLYTDDIEFTEDAGHLLRIRGNSARKTRVKGKKNRDLPIHPELVRLGLLDYWEAIKAHGVGPLFPAITWTELNGAGGKPSDWFGKSKKAKGVDSSMTFHSFRHTLLTRLQALGVPESHAFALSGHAATSVGRRSYTRLTPADLRPSLERLSFPFLELPRVFVTPAWKPG